MQKINMNAVATRVAMAEGQKVEVNIAQIKEVLKVFLEELSKYEDDEILELVKRHK
jgi:predicted DNA-binding antitoxin AbrB/MazE fold protein